MTTSAAERIVSALYSAAQLFTLLQINGAVEGTQRTPSHRAMNWLFIALVLSVVGDLVFQLMYSTGSRGVNWSHASSIAANLAMIWSANLSRNHRGGCFLQAHRPECSSASNPIDSLVN